MHLLPFPGVVVSGRQPLRGPAEERGERRRVGAGDRRRPLERLEQPQPLVGRLGPEDAAGPVDHRRHADVLERLADHRRLAVGAHEHGHVPGLDGLGPGVAATGRRHPGAGAQQPHDVGGHVADDVPPRVAGPRVAARRLRQILAQRHAEPERRRHRRPTEAGLLVLVSGPDLAVGDALVAELDPGEQRVVGVDQALIRAPVDRQRRLPAGRARRVQVRVHVGAAEGVDRLLGVGDQHQGGPALPEREAHDLPLRRIGVLELVDEHHLVARAQLGGDAVAAGPPQRGPQPGHQVVIGHDHHRPLALLELGAGDLGEPEAHLRDRAVGAHQARRRVVDRGSGDRRRLGAAERRRALGVALRRGEPADVEVVDDIVDEVGEVLDEGDVGLEVAGDAQAAEHLLAEAVGGGDGGGVEAGDRPSEVVAMAARVTARQQRHDGVLVVGGRRPGQAPAQAALDADQPLAHPLAQLAGGDARERDEQQALERDPLGDVARRERRDRVGLAGPGAGLQHRHAGGQRAAGIELHRLQGDGSRGHWARTSSRASSPSHNRRASRPKREASDSAPPAQPSPRSSSAGAMSSTSVSVSTPPNAIWCSASRSSLSKFHSVSHSLSAAANASWPRRAASA